MGSPVGDNGNGTIQLWLEAENRQVTLSALQARILMGITATTKDSYVAVERRALFRLIGDYFGNRRPAPPAARAALARSVARLHRQRLLYRVRNEVNLTEAGRLAGRVLL